MSLATITNSLTAPMVNGDDIANLAAPTGSQPTWSDRPVQGQTFMSPATGGDLTSITLQMYEKPEKAPINGWKDFLLRFGTIDTFSNEINSLLITKDRYEPDAASDSFFTFTFDTPITLAPSTLYGFDVGVLHSEEDWPSGVPAFRTTGNNYADGRHYTGAHTGTIDHFFGVPKGIGFENGDLVFHANIVPEPGSFAVIGLGGMLLGLRRRR